MSESSTFLKVKPQGGFKRWFFIDPDTHEEFQAASRIDLIRRIVLYREQNGLPPLEELGTVIENFLCYQPENLGQCEPHTLNRSFVATIQGGIALLKNAFLPEKFRTTPVEAERRAQICSKCPLNQYVGDKSLATKAGDAVAEAALRGLKTNENDKLFSCGVCGCPLKVIVWHKDFFQEPEDKKAKYPDFCWKKPLV
jgi:hypothetical protein